jgi:hypothetical protein
MKVPAWLATPATGLLARRALTLAWIAVKLVLVGAMMNRNVAQFIYAGF